MFTFTDMAVDYSVDELDDLTDRKVAPEGIDGDRMARIIRRRQGTARATLAEDNYAGVTDSASFGLWGDVTHTDGNRRMAAVGFAAGNVLAYSDGADMRLGLPNWEYDVR